MRNFEELDVWKKAHQLVLNVYACTSKFPDEEKYSLTDQIRRAGVSIPSNIAEGCGKDSDQDFLRFLAIARSSCNELDYQLRLAGDLDYLSDDHCNDLRNQADEVRKMLSGFIKAIRD